MIRYLLVYTWHLIKNIINYIFNTIGYIRIYDLHSGYELTFIYFLLKIIKKFGYKIKLNYSHVGVCRYVNNRFVRYICYDIKLNNINKNIYEYNSKNYHNIKKIELITKKKNTNKIISNINVTPAKTNFYDQQNKSSLIHTTISDVVKFYLLLNSYYFNINILYNNKNDNYIRITKKKFNNDTLENDITFEEHKIYD